MAARGRCHGRRQGRRGLRGGVRRGYRGRQAATGAGKDGGACGGLHQHRTARTLPAGPPPRGGAKIRAAPRQPRVRAGGLAFRKSAPPPPPARRPADPYAVRRLRNLRARLPSAPTAQRSQARNWPARAALDPATRRREHIRAQCRILNPSGLTRRPPTKD